MSTDSRLFAYCASVVLLASLFVVGEGFAAQRKEDAPSVTVKFEDLNLKSAAGVASLYKRIHAAAQSVCTFPDDGISLELRALALKCTAESEARAIEKVNKPELTTYYRQLKGKSTPAVAMNPAH
jgi:UrcA family protein